MNKIFQTEHKLGSILLRNQIRYSRIGAEIGTYRRDDDDKNTTCYLWHNHIKLVENEKIKKKITLQILMKQI